MMIAQPAKSKIIKNLKTNICRNWKLETKKNENLSKPKNQKTITKLKKIFLGEPPSKQKS